MIWSSAPSPTFAPSEPSGKVEQNLFFPGKPEQPIWVRVEKRDGRLRFLYSTDEEWHDGPIAADEPWTGELKVGVCASNTTTNARWFRFRDLQIREPGPAWVPLFNGKDLSGWFAD